MPPETTNLLEAAKEIDRLSLVIEGAVRSSDPTNSDAVGDALRNLRAALPPLPKSDAAHFADIIRLAEHIK